MLDERSGDDQALPLAAAEVAAELAHLTAVTVDERGDVVVKVCEAGGPLDFLVRHAVSEEAYVSATVPAIRCAS